MVLKESMDSGPRWGSKVEEKSSGRRELILTARHTQCPLAREQLGPQSRPGRAGMWTPAEGVTWAEASLCPGGETV